MARLSLHEMTRHSPHSRGPLQEGRCLNAGGPRSKSRSLGRRGPGSLCGPGTSTLTDAHDNGQLAHCSELATFVGVGVCVCVRTAAVRVN